MPRKTESEASLRRKALGIIEIKDPVKQERARKMTADRVSNREKIKKDAVLQAVIEQKAHINMAVDAVSSVVAGNLKSKEKQVVVRGKVLDLFIEKSEDVAKRLVELSLGQGTFSEAPASVQRLAMMDVLRLAGISEKDAEAQAKDVKEMTREELIQFLKQAQAVADEVQSKQGITIDLEELK